MPRIEKPGFLEKYAIPSFAHLGELGGAHRRRAAPFDVKGTRLASSPFSSALSAQRGVRVGWAGEECVSAGVLGLPHLDLVVA